MAITINGDGALTASGTAATQGQIILAERTGNGTNTVTVQAPTSLAADFTLTLPTADGTNGQFLQTNGSGQLAFATPAAGAMVLLANLTPAAAAANIDALDVFTATYDNYLILLQGIQTTNATGSSFVRMRYAVSGAADTNTRYTSGTYGSGLAAQAFSSTSINVQLGLGTLDATGPGLNAAITIQNVNATNSSFKTAFITMFCNPNGATTFDFGSGAAAYNGTSALSGVRFFLNNGANFAARGNVRIYGILNT
jgi:hypothetical protein